MEITLSNSAPATLKTGVLVVGAFADGLPAPAAQLVDEALGGMLSAAIKRGDLGEKAGSILLFPGPAGAGAERVLLVSVGKRADLGDKTFRQALTATAKALADGAAKSAVVTLADIDLPDRPLAWRVQQAAQLLADGAYKFDAPREKKRPERGANAVTLTLTTEATAELQAAVAQGLAIAEGIALTKDLGNLGGNVCNPAYMAETAQALGKEFGFEVEVLEREDMAKLGMDSALSVGRASYSPCKFIVMNYSGGDWVCRSTWSVW
jgi:leucyl aminopeptidase